MAQAQARPVVPKLMTADAHSHSASYSDMSGLLRHALYSSNALNTSGNLGSVSSVCTPSAADVCGSDATALLAAARFDLDQHFLLWASLPATQTLLKDMLADVAAGKDLDIQAIVARVRASAVTTNPQSGAPTSAAGSTGGFAASGGMKLLSPRRANTIGGSPNTPTGGSRRPTPPMSPTGLSTTAPASMRGALSPMSGRSPPSSPRHFTFGAGAPARDAVGMDDAYPSPAQVASHGAAGTMLSPQTGSLSSGRSPRGEAFPLASSQGGPFSPPGTSNSPTSPVATHGIGIAMSITSPPAIGMGTSSPSLLTTSATSARAGGAVGFSPSSTGSTGSHRHSASAPASLLASGGESPRDRDASSPLPPLASPQPSPNGALTSPPGGMTSKAAMIVAARNEAFPVSTGAATAARGRSSTSPTSLSPASSAGRTGSPGALSSFESKEADLEEFTGTSKEDDEARVSLPDEEKPATRSPVARKSPTASGAAAAVAPAGGEAATPESKAEASPTDRQGATSGAGATANSPGASVSPARGALLSAFEDAKNRSTAPSTAAASAPAGEAGKMNTAIPQFFIQGEGGRGRGRAIKSDALTERLPSILELFRRHNAATIPPAPSVRVRSAATPASTSNRALTKAGSKQQLLSRTASGRALSVGDDDDADGVAVPTEIRVDVADVSISWEDAHLGIPVEHFAAVAKTLCGFPSFFAAPLFRRVRAQCGGAANANGAVVVPPDMFVENLPADTAAEAGATGGRSSSRGRSRHPSIDMTTVRQRVLTITFKRNPPEADNPDDRDTSGVVPLPMFLEFWRQEIAPYDHVDRFFRLVKRRAAHYIEPPDFMPFMEELLAFHPGLAFLESTPEFQEKYARTVIARIFYVLDPAARKCIDQRALRRSNLLEAFHTVDVEEDINLVNDYFSYEHFYVLYCKFWELDADHDFFLTRADLNKITDLTRSVLDRVFQQTGRPFTSGSRDKMSFEDFIVFFMSEEDKTSEASLRYWFNVCDLDSDGVLTANELRFFYREQEQRMRDLGMEVVKFEDVLCQLHDLLKPRTNGRITLADFLHPERVKLTGVLFSAMFNLTKFQAFEARDPVLVKQELNLQGVTQWDRYAQAEYARLASEEEDAAAAANSVTAAGGAAYMGAGAYMNSGGHNPGASALVDAASDFVTGSFGGHVARTTGAADGSSASDGGYERLIGHNLLADLDEVSEQHLQRL